MSRLLSRLPFARISALALSLVLCGPAHAQDRIRIVVQPEKVRQVFEGLGAGAILFEQHITSLAARDLHERQEQLYDDMFARVPTRYLQIMIRETHEPIDDNPDPYNPKFDAKNFDYCKHPLQIAKAALKRRPDMQFMATLYSPPPWMKTNKAASGGGKAKHTIVPGSELKLARYLWGFLEHMHKNGVTVQYLSIANEPDFPHEQPGYFLTPERYAALFKIVGETMEKMAKKYPEVPRVKLVGPNTLSAVGAGKQYVPLVLQKAGRFLDVVAAHDYDPRGDRWGDLRKLAGKRPVWMTEWCARTKDPSRGMINSATEYGLAMHAGFTGGANVWMAYDWVYPPRNSGEGLIHVDWGKDYRLTKPYFLFRQWAEPLTPGMRVVDLSPAGTATLKPTAFLSADGRTLVVHVVNAQDRDAPILLALTGKLAKIASAGRTRTSATEDVAALPPLTKSAAGFLDNVPGRAMVTYRFEAVAK